MESIQYMCNRSFVFLVLATVCVAAIFMDTLGCRPKLDSRDKRSIRICDELIHSGESSARAKVLAMQVKNEVISGKYSSSPILLQAALRKADTSDEAMLFMYVWSPQGFVNGFVIRETTIDANGVVKVLEEDYTYLPVRSGSGLVYPKIDPVRIRDRDQRKDEAVWSEYLQHGDPLLPCPDIWISSPIQGTREVEILLYDKAGRKSEPMPVNFRIVPEQEMKLKLVVGDR
jgi:hypothetical protein